MQLFLLVSNKRMLCVILIHVYYKHIWKSTQPKLTKCFTENSAAPDLSLQSLNSNFIFYYIQCTYSALQKFMNKIKYFLTISKNVLILNALYKQYGSKIRPNETLGLIFYPYCLIPSISFC